MDQDEINECLLKMEKMGLLKRHYDSATKEILWELTRKGIKAKERLGRMSRIDPEIN